MLGRVRPGDRERGRPVALAAGPAGPDQPGDGQVVLADRVDAEQVAVGQRPPWLAGVELVVVLPGDDQVADVGAGAVPAAPAVLPGWSWPQSSR